MVANARRAARSRRLASSAAALFCIIMWLLTSPFATVNPPPPPPPPPLPPPIVERQTAAPERPAEATLPPPALVATQPAAAATNALAAGTRPRPTSAAAALIAAPTEAPSEAPEPIAPARSRDPSQPPRVGVCIVGGVRTLSVTWEHLWANGIEALQPDPARRRVLFETTLADDCASNRDSSQHVVESCRQHIASSAAFLHSGNVTGHPTRRFDLHVDDALTNCSHPFASRHQCCKEYPQGMDAGAHQHVWGLRQYLRKAQCSARLLQIEKDTGVPFDVVMWIRPDLYLFDQLPSAEQVLRSRYPRVLLSSKEKGQSVGDYIFVAPGPLFARWHQAIFGAHELKCRERKDQIPEERLDTYRKAKKIPTQIYPFVFAIARSNELADCMRLRNEVLASVSMVDEVTGDTVTPFDLCRRRFPQRDRGNALPAYRPAGHRPAGAPNSDGGMSAAEAVQQLRAQQAAEENARFSGAVRRNKVRAGVPEDEPADDDHDHDRHHRGAAHRHHDRDVDDRDVGGRHRDTDHHSDDRGRHEQRSRRRHQPDPDDDGHDDRRNPHDHERARREDNADHRRMIRQRMEEHRRVMRERNSDFFARDN